MQGLLNPLTCVIEFLLNTAKIVPCSQVVTLPMYSQGSGSYLVLSFKVKKTSIFAFSEHIHEHSAIFQRFEFVPFIFYEAKNHELNAPLISSTVFAASIFA